MKNGFMEVHSINYLKVLNIVPNKQKPKIVKYY